MRYASRLYLLALLMCMQSVTAAWAQTNVIGTLPSATEAIHTSEHCGAMKATGSIDAIAFKADAASTAKSVCPCCEKQCFRAHCSAVQLLVALSEVNTCMQFAPVAFTPSRFSQVADRHYLRPPTPPPNHSKVN